MQANSTANFTDGTHFVPATLTYAALRLNVQCGLKRSEAIKERFVLPRFWMEVFGHVSPPAKLVCWSWTLCAGSFYDLYLLLYNVHYIIARGGWPRVFIHFTFLRSLLTVTIDTEKSYGYTLALLSYNT